jgi:hypothetical protein
MVINAKMEHYMVKIIRDVSLKAERRPELIRDKYELHIFYMKHTG